MKKFMERFIEAVRKYEELLAYAQGEFILPYHSGAGMIGYYYSPIPLIKQSRKGMPGGKASFLNYLKINSV